ncbi:glycoside hydrolase family 15 protein [Streptomyces sp. NPDC046275]|uniref:glycoside hydrolase family 15 protein n=1 Tax=Streptomyces sp. NPDC046275 TaxID=3157201 RepID=UPI0033F63EE8
MTLLSIPLSPNREGVRDRSLRIEDYALLGDMKTAALAGRDGAVDWLCMPHFDSGAVFAGLLGDEENGSWRIAPTVPAGQAMPHARRRRYRGDSLILESEWDTATGTVRLTEFMPPRASGGPRLIRIVEGIRGTVHMTSSLSPRFRYGSTRPWIDAEAGRFFAMAGPDAVWLDTETEVTEKNNTLHSDFTINADERVAFTLSWRPSPDGPPQQIDPHQALTATEEFWRTWVARCTYDGPYREAVVRALITLKALTHTATGGTVAAPTTSLPEEIGGVRNWDYRYTWLRDAADTLGAMVRGGFLQEARDWLDWLVRTVADDVEKLQIMYTIRGERELPERELPWLTGYEGSGPVRIGNGAVHQLQLDVFGEVLELIALAHANGIALSRQLKALIQHLISKLQKTWRQPDAGIWEIRGELKHFVHSKVMAWVAVSRAIGLVEDQVLDMDLHGLKELRDEIHADVCDKGYDPVRNTFTQSYGSAELDAALLLIPRTGFLPADDPRVIGTVHAVRQELATPEGLVRRYPTAGEEKALDGLTGDEGRFLLCSFWLVDALALTGQRAEALHVFEYLLSLRSDTGLLAEEYDPAAGRQIGNYPQGFSALGIVTTAVNLQTLEAASGAMAEARR